MTFNFKHIIFAVIVLFVSYSSLADEKNSNTVMVFAAASLSPAMNDIVNEYNKVNPNKVILTVASSATLAKQIQHGAPADIYLSANLKWMSYLQNNNLIDIKSRKYLLKNHLVMIAPKDYQIKEVDLNDINFDKILLGTKLAIGNPAYVPAGIYAKQSLLYYKIWEKAEPLIVNTNNVRAALALVEQKESMLGIVYRTDALASHKVKIVANLSDLSHDSIIYPMARINKSNVSIATMDFYEFLNGSQSMKIFIKYGFEINK